MQHLVTPLLLALIITGGTAIPASAQETPVAAAASSIARPATDSIFRRARRLVLDGNGAAGRAIVDSLLQSAPPGTAAYGDALYWHGALAPTIAEAERDYRRVIVEYPLAYYADDALLAIAELEQARGDRASALAHLQRFVKEHPASPARGIAALGAARLAFEQRDTRLGCSMLTEARALVGTSDVELNNQITYFSGRCPTPAPTVVARLGSVPTKAATPVDSQSAATRSGVARVEPDSLPRSAASTAVAPAPVVSAPVAPTIVPPAPRDTTPTRPVVQPVRPAVTAAAKVVVPPVASTPAATQPAAAARGRYTIQLAAFNTRPEAERMVATLVKKGLPARVSGEAKPFRVRLQYFPTWRAASAELTSLKARGIVGFVAEEP